MKSWGFLEDVCEARELVNMSVQQRVYKEPSHQHAAVGYRAATLASCRRLTAWPAGVFPTNQSGAMIGQSSVILADRPKSRHCATSLAISAPNASGVPPTGSTPSRLSRPARSGVRTARWNADASFSITGFGVPAGATTPIYRMPSYPGSPISATVGTFGISVDRSRLAKASARSLPCATCWFAVA